MLVDRARSPSPSPAGSPPLGEAVATASGDQTHILLPCFLCASERGFLRPRRLRCRWSDELGRRSWCSSGGFPVQDLAGPTHHRGPGERHPLSGELRAGRGLHDVPSAGEVVETLLVERELFAVRC